MTTTKFEGVQQRENKNKTISYTVNYYVLDKKKSKMVGNSKDGMTAKKASKIRTNLIETATEMKEEVKQNSLKKSVFEVGNMTLDECFIKYYTPVKQNLKSFKESRVNIIQKLIQLLDILKLKT